MIQLGLERCLTEPPPILQRGHFGLLMNQASVDQRFRYACDLLADRLPGRLRAIFSPQHGLWGEQQANMIESPDARYEPLDLPIFSLYSHTRRPTDEMLAGLDCLVIDLQDVGTRVYTFIWTISHCLEACAAVGIPVIVLDRPNPLGGTVVEGPLLEAGFESFVGRAAIPMRHALSIGELAQLVNRQRNIGAELSIIPMSGWRRSMLFSATERSWVPPSPNMPGFLTALFYPGQVLLEGTNLSEGRGTTTPFSLVGAPFIDPWRLTQELQRFRLPGVSLRPVSFVPTFDKWRGERCRGIALHASSPELVRSFDLTVAILSAVRRLWPDELQWLPPPYEYEFEKMPIDILFGSERLRTALDGGQLLNEDALESLCHVDAQAWHAQTSPFRLYD